MQQRMFEILEFNKILDILTEYALSDKIKEKIRKLEPYMNESEVKRQMNETTQAKMIIESVGTPPVAIMSDLEKVLVLVDKDAMLLPEQLEIVRGFIITCKRMKAYLKRAEFTSTEVSVYGRSINDLTELSDEIDNAIRGGVVDDKASTKLANVRKKKILADEKIKAKLESLLKNNKNYFSDNFVISRNGHYTLPVKKEYKGRIKGAVIDSSKTGSTYFIEPCAIEKIQNELLLLNIEEENEVRRILYALTALVEDFLPLIRVNIQAMETLDFLFAKAKLSIEMNAVPAEVTTDKKIFIKSGRHPLLHSDTVVPLDFQLGYDNEHGDTIKRIIITGPNTGGKTVALKTVGLLSTMAQCGLHVPAEKASLCMHNMVLCDIGDGQSISENLSTFSSHMTNIIRIINTADDQSLVLLDELGSGTDPTEGMGLATVILEELAKKDCLVVATTHYPEIKEFVRNTTGFVNARMSFDRQSLKPLYKLVIGEAGDSCALYIAKRLGLPQKMIERAYSIAYKRDNVVHQGSEHKQMYNWNINRSEDKSKKDRQGEHTIKSKSKNHNRRIIKEKEKNKPNSNNSIKFNIGDSVIVYPEKVTGIVFQKSNDIGEVGVQIKGEKQLINHKRLKLHIAASELYPENYDFSIIFDSVETRKARHQMSRKYDPNISIEIEEEL